jgi:hypothetical protein
MRDDETKWAEYLKVRANRYKTSSVARLTQYKNNANRKKLEWTINDDTFVILMRLSCHYCGELPDPLNGVDRKHNTEGYSSRNCVPCCKFCNYAKRNFTYEEFIAWIKRAAVYQNTKDTLSM